MKRKIDVMHEYYGASTDGGKCRECEYFMSGKYRGKSYKKCLVYGVSHSEATDWTGKWTACCLKNSPEVAGREKGRVMELYQAEHRGKKLYQQGLEPMKGQIALNEYERTD